jgi:hypothetical protein
MKLQDRVRARVDEQLPRRSPSSRSGSPLLAGVTA